MVNVEWKDEYNLGIESIDQQHQKLFEYMGELRRALIEEDYDHIGVAIDGLLNYGVEHFGYEEKLLLDHQYPLEEDHCSMHDIYNGKLLRFRRLFEQGEGFLATEILVFVKNWLLSHILKEDKQYADYFREKGIDIK